MYYYTTDYRHRSLRLCAGKGEITVNPKLNKDYRERNISMLPQKVAMVKDVAKTNKAGGFTKRIGHTTYRVGIHFSDTSRETMDEKIIRIIRNESTERAAVNQ